MASGIRLWFGRVGVVEEGWEDDALDGRGEERREEGGEGSRGGGYSELGGNVFLCVKRVRKHEEGVRGRRTM